MTGHSGRRAEHVARPSVFLAGCVALVAWSLGAQAAAGQTASAPATFARDVAPILYTQCANCHRPDGSAPFSLITYRRGSAARCPDRQSHSEPRHATLETESRHRAFHRRTPIGGSRDRDHRPLGNAKAEEKVTVRALPQLPHWSSGWQLGTPDLIVELPEYTLAATTADTFRNFVVSLPTKGARYVRGLEFRPDSPVVHHANLFVDTTPASRRLDDADSAPGYEGLIPFSAAFPEGHILAWTPGQVPTLAPTGMAWRLEPGTDLLVQLHMQPTSRAVRLRPVVGLFFTNDAPTLVPTALRLGRQDIDMAPGDARYRTSDSYRITRRRAGAGDTAARSRASPRSANHSGPARRNTAHASGDWRLGFALAGRLPVRGPVWLPAGTKLVAEFTFDNSAANRRNPDAPLKSSQLGCHSRRTRWVTRGLKC